MMQAKPRKRDTGRAIERIETGVPNLDAILGGGLPKTSVTVVSGPPGSGKTILAEQICFHSASAKRPVLYFSTLSEPTVKTLQYLRAFDFFDPKRVGKDVHFVDLGSIMRSEGLATAAALIVQHLKKIKPAFVVIDSFKVFDDLSKSKGEMRKFGYEVAVSLMAWETTSFLIGEYAPTDLETNPVFSIVDGIFYMYQRESLGEHGRFMKVIKMRGTGHSRDDQAFDITSNGIAMFPPKVSLKRSSSGGKGRCVTGIRKLDQLLGPGIPWGSSLLISGVAGTGKTILALEFLYRGALKGEKGIFFSFEETEERLLASASGMGWDFKKYMDNGLLQIVFIPQPDIQVEAHILMMRDRLEALKAKRVVMDSVSVFMHKITEPQIVREKMFHLCTIVQNAQAVGFFPTDIPYGSTQVSRFGVEETVVDGVIILTAKEEGWERQRYLEIYKLRSTPHYKGRHNLLIEPGGVAVFPRYGLEERPESEPPPLEVFRLGTGVAGLDELLGGGLLGRSVTLLSGSAGSGKTTMGMQFLLEGARKHTRGLYVTPEEGPEQLMASAGSLGLPMRAAMKKGLVEVLYARRELLRSGQFLSIITEKMQSMKAVRVVLDAASPLMAGAPTQDDPGAVLYKLAARFKTLRVTSLVALETADLFQTDATDGRGLSAIADNLLRLRYQHVDGTLLPTLTIIKTRGSNSSRGTYTVITGKGGLRVGPLVGQPASPAVKKRVAAGAKRTRKKLRA